jgi:hypothetical protein
MIQAQIPIVATVQVEETSARYVRVVAVDQTGNKSGPSDAATATALLIDDAHISDLTVSKVTAGQVNADWVVAARIKTADSGARVELNSGGIGAWNSSGQQTVAIAGADGSVTIVGQLKSGTSGKRIEINPTSTYLPEIRWYANTGTDYGYINAVSSGTDVALGMNSSDFDDSGVAVLARTYLSSTFAELAIVRSDNQERRGGYMLATPSTYYAGVIRDGTDGGYLYADSDQGKFGWNPNDSTNGQYHYYASGRTRHIGRWGNFVSAASNEGIFTGSDTVTSVTSSSYGFGATMLTSMVPIVTLRASNFGTATPTVWGVQSINTTGFTVAWNNSQSMNINWWVYRV